MQASLTGHLVFSTLHTNDAPSTITRMKDMGVPTFLITATVEAILAQRLVRKVCMQCREEYTPPREMLDDLELTVRPGSRQPVFPRRRLRSLQQHGLQRPRRPVRADDHEQRPARHDHGQRPGRRAARRWRTSRAWSRCAQAGIKGCFDGVTTPDEVVRETILEA